jgi:lipopolysaccharide export system permease protein
VKEKKKPLPKDISVIVYTLEQQSDILKIAVSNQTSIAYSIESTKLELDNKQEY